MSEDRTQPASKRRLQIAREQGQVAHSPELTAAGGWLVAVLLLGFWCEDLAGGLIGLVRRSAGGAPVVCVDGPAFVSAHPASGHGGGCSPGSHTDGIRGRGAGDSSIASTRALGNRIDCPGPNPALDSRSRRRTDRRNRENLPGR